MTYTHTDYWCPKGLLVFGFLELTTVSVVVTFSCCPAAVYAFRGAEVKKINKPTVINESKCYSELQVVSIVTSQCSSTCDQEGAVAPQVTQGPVFRQTCVQARDQRRLPYVYLLMYQRMFERISNISLGGISHPNVGKEWNDSSLLKLRG